MSTEEFLGHMIAFAVGFFVTSIITSIILSAKSDR